MKTNSAANRAAGEQQQYTKIMALRQMRAYNFVREQAE
jgi:hypothetical protein